MFEYTFYKDIILAPMENEESKPSKRVSFAPEPEINYIYQDESTVTKMSSFSDMPMDITTELEDLKNLNLFTLEENEKFCNENQETRRQSIAPGSIKRMSLNPLDHIQFNYEPENEKNDENSCDRSNDLSNTNNSLIKGEPLAINLEKNKVHNLFWSSSINNARPSLDGSFDNHGNFNSSFDVGELVNTIDLKKIIPQENTETLDITEFLASQGIRFLDETAIDGMKRDTLSKSRNVIDPSLVVYYEYSLKERIDFLFNFSNFLIDKMKDLQREIDVVKNNIDIKSINKENLKRIRNDSRNKSKIDWYSLRKIYEIQFNKKILENRNKVSDILSSLIRENQSTEEQILKRKNSIETLKVKIQELKGLVSRMDQQSIQKTECFREMIDERKKILQSTKKELDEKKLVLEAQKNEESNIQRRITKLQSEISSLKKNLSIRNVGESQLEEITKIIERYSKYYKFKLIKMDYHSIVFEIGEITVNADYNSSLEVVRHNAQCNSKNPFSEFKTCLLNIKADGVHIRDFIKQCFGSCVLIQSFEKEIDLIKEKVRIELQYLNTYLYLRIFLALDAEYFEIMFDESLNLIFEKERIGNLINTPGLVTTFINSKLNN